MTNDTMFLNIVGVRYGIGKQIGEGSFGTVFEGTNMLDNQRVAIKFEPYKSTAPQLFNEYRTYKVLCGRRKFSGVTYSLPSRRLHH